MENASKALLIAGGILISLIVISGLILAMRKMGDFQTATENAKLEQQTREFNSVYESYDRKNIRGNDIISLMNRIIDYNERKVKEGYTKMEVTFDIPENIKTKLAYDGQNLLIKTTHYTQENIDKIVGTPDASNPEYSISGIEGKYGQRFAMQLSQEIFNIQTLAESHKSIAEIDEEFAKTYKFPKKVSEYGGINQMYQDAKLYYEYVQFKRTYYDCVSKETDPDTDRIIKMEFKCTGIGV